MVSHVPGEKPVENTTNQRSSWRNSGLDGLASPDRGRAFASARMAPVLEAVLLRTVRQSIQLLIE